MPIKLPEEEWLTVDDAKNKMFDIDNDNIIRYRMRFKGRGILEKKEVIFFEIIFPPRSFTSSKYTRYKMKAALLEFNHIAKKWVIDSEVLTVTLSKKDYDWFQAVRIKSGDRVKAFHYGWRIPGGLFRRSISWECCKRCTPK